MLNNLTSSILIPNVNHKHIRNFQSSFLSMSGDAMDTLKSKIGLITKQSEEYNARIKAAKQEKEHADAKVKELENRIKELSRLLHVRKIELDEKNEACNKNAVSIKRKEEATAAAKDDINVLKMKALTLKAEVDRVSIALPETMDKLCTVSKTADNQLSDIKKLEIRAMLADQTIEEMEQQLYFAETMALSTNHKVDEMQKKMQLRDVELIEAQSKVFGAQERQQSTTENLRNADMKMANLQYKLEEKVGREMKYKKQIQLLQAQLEEIDCRNRRKVDLLINMKQNLSIRAAGGYNYDKRKISNSNSP